MEMTWKLHCFHLVVSHHGKDIISTNRNNKANFKLHFKQVMETVWFPCGDYLVSMWRPLGLHVDTMVSMWFLCEHNMVIMWTPCGFEVDTMWFPCGHHMVSKFLCGHHHFQPLQMRSRSMETRSRLDLLLDYPHNGYLFFSRFTSFPNHFSCY